MEGTFVSLRNTLTRAIQTFYLYIYNNKIIIVENYKIDMVKTPFNFSCLSVPAYASRVL